MGIGVGVRGGEAVDVGCGVFVGLIVGVETVVGVGRGVLVASGWLQEMAAGIERRSRTPMANVIFRNMEPPCGNRTVRTLPQEPHVS